MGILDIIAIGGLILKTITAVESIFDGEGEGEQKKAAVMSVAQIALSKAIPNADPEKLVEAAAIIDEFIESGVKLMKAVSK